MGDMTANLPRVFASLTQTRAPGVDDARIDGANIGDFDPERVLLSDVPD